MKSMRAGWLPLVVGAAFCQTAADVPAFEVASVKQAAPITGNRIMVRMGGDPSRVDYANVSLKDVVARAYGLKRYQVHGPSWIDSERYDIVAKVPDGVSVAKVPLMLQNLLAERFKMVVHREKKEQPVYGLVVGKGGPKLKKSENAENEPPPGVPGVPGGRQQTRTRMMMGRDGHMEIKGATMGGFAEMLSNMLDRPVLDETRIEGQYDIDLEVATEDLAGMRKMAIGAGHPPMGPGGPGGPEGAPAPEGAPKSSIFTAIQQLGLKLDPRKGPIEHVIVDQAEKVPTAN
jgi:uncharacterized protein (TIGR03435 family)